jgi:hypothetical protein
MNAAVAWSGARSLLLGTLPGESNSAGTSAAAQAVTVPPWASTLIVAARTRQGTDGPQGNDFQRIVVAPGPPGSDAQPLGVVLSERAINATWRHRSLTTFVDDLRGRELWIQAAVVNDGRYAKAWMFMDDVEAIFCP